MKIDTEMSNTNGCWFEMPPNSTPRSFPRSFNIDFRQHMPSINTNAFPPNHEMLSNDYAAANAISHRMSQMFVQPVASVPAEQNTFKIGIGGTVQANSAHPTQQHPQQQRHTPTSNLCKIISLRNQNFKAKILNFKKTIDFRVL